MPTLEYNEPCLEGRAYICKYKDRKYFNLRVKREGHRYTHISLNTTDLEKAKKVAIDAYVKVIKEPPRSSKSTMTIERIFEKFMDQKQLDTDRGQTKYLTKKIYGQRIEQRYLPYLSWKNLKNIKAVSYTHLTLPTIYSV